MFLEELKLKLTGLHVGMSPSFSTVKAPMALKGHSGSETQLDLDHGTILIQTIHGTNGIFTDPWIVDFYGKLLGKFYRWFHGCVDGSCDPCHVPIESCLDFLGGSGGSKGQGGQT